MEITIENKIKLNSNQIIGVMDQEQYLLDYLKSINYSKNNIVVDGKKFTSKELISFKRKISIIENYITDDDLDLTVYEYMKYKLFSEILDIKDYRKKIKDSLKIVGLSESYLDKKISKLSKIEKQWVNFSIGLFSNPDMIVLNRVFHSLDITNTKKMIRLLQQLVEQYHKVVIIYTNDAEIIYKFTHQTIIIKDSNVLVEGFTENIFQDHIDMLLNNNIQVPKTIEFSYLVNQKKNIKLGYFRDIRDLIKDIYKKV